MNEHSAENDVEALADFIAAHDAYRVNEDGWSVCVCGHVAVDDDDGSHARHLAAVLVGVISPVVGENDAGDWIDRPDARVISDDLGAAFASMDRAYYQSDSAATLCGHVAEAITHLERLRDRIDTPIPPEVSAS